MAVLIAIAIPIFTSQLEKSREATDLANVRSAYAECSASAITGTATDDSVTVTKANGVVTAEKTVTLNQTQSGWEGDNGTATIGEFSVDAWGPGTVTVTVTDDGNDPTFTYTAA